MGDPGVRLQNVGHGATGRVERPLQNDTALVISDCQFGQQHRKRRETVQVRETGAIGVDGEHRAVTRTAPKKSRAIEGVARQNQSPIRISSIVVVSIKRE